MSTPDTKVQQRGNVVTHVTPAPGSVSTAWRGDPAEIVAASEPDPLGFLRRVASLRPAWMADALCAEFDVDAWFPTIGQSNQPALEICGRCPVRGECLTWAIDNGVGHGVWGGMSPAARRAHARGRS